MICLIVNDACCLIDLHKVRLLPDMLRLPYRFLVPPPVRYSELLHLTASDWRCLEDAGLETSDPSLEQVAEALAVRRQHPVLSPADCACLVEARHHRNGMLLTGDRRLRRVAEAIGICVHGVLWIIDQLSKFGICSAKRLSTALKSWRADRTVFLPRPEIDRRLRRLRNAPGAAS